MDVHCHRCGVAVPADAAFCASCGAPQISVSKTEVPEPVTPIPVGGAYPHYAGANYPRVNWRVALPITVTVGLASAVVSLAPYVSLGCCLWLLAAGAISVVLYAGRPLSSPVDTGAGARIGAVTGLFGYLFFTMFLAIWLAFQRFVLHRAQDFRNAIRDALMQAAARNPNPQASEIAQRMATPEGMAMIITLTLVAFLFGFIIFSAIGGVIGAAVAPKKTTKIQPM